MKKFNITCDIVSGRLSAIIEAESEAEAKEKFNELGADELMEEADRRLENYKVEEV